MRMEIALSNAASTSREFQLEPWGGQYTLAAKSSLKLVIDSPTTPLIELELGQEMTRVIVHGPAGADAAIYDGDREVRAH